MKILAVCIGAPETLPGLRYKTGIRKMAISGLVQVDGEGMVGDAICNRRHHGGPDQAIYVEGAQTLAWWAEALGRPLPPGTFGENLVIGGLDNRDVAVGDRFYAGDVVLEATSARIPCNTFAARMEDPRFVKRYTEAARPGFYCRVIAGGLLRAEMTVTCARWGGERVTMPELLATFGKRLEGAERERQLATPINARIRAFLTGAP